MIYSLGVSHSRTHTCAGTRVHAHTSVPESTLQCCSISGVLWKWSSYNCTLKPSEISLFPMGGLVPSRVYIFSHTDLNGTALCLNHCIWAQATGPGCQRPLSGGVMLVPPFRMLLVGSGALPVCLLSGLALPRTLDAAEGSPPTLPVPVVTGI